MKRVRELGSREDIVRSLSRCQWAMEELWEVCAEIMGRGPQPQYGEMDAGLPGDWSHAGPDPEFDPSFDPEFDI